jgi:CheY-like chemotaxis protein/HPt (histidine-containing phosphotransfer) domain-containing protein
MKDNILENKRVLVAEDDAINQMVVKHSLLKLGADADIAGDGAEAIEKFKAGTYDLILMDIQMPLMDGYEATIYIREQLQSNVPIIAMTAFALNSEDKKCFECGMNGSVSKPFDLESLSNAIQKVLTVPNEVNNNPYIFGTKDVAVDLSMLYDISGNDESYIHKMIQTFLDNMPNTLHNIEQSLQEKDWDKVYKSAHYAKSSLSVIKISEVFDWVLSIEQNAKHKINLEGLPAIFDKVKAKFKMAEQVLREKFTIGSPS